MAAPIAAAFKRTASVIPPLRARDLARLHHAPGVRRQAARLQADDVGNIHSRQHLVAAGQVAGAEDLEIVRGGVAGETQVLPALAENFVDHRSGSRSAPKPPMAR